jgi:hypothetical protein
MPIPVRIRVNFKKIDEQCDASLDDAKQLLGGPYNVVIGGPNKITVRDDMCEISHEYTHVTGDSVGRMTNEWIAGNVHVTVFETEEVLSSVMPSVVFVSDRREVGEKLAMKWTSVRRNRDLLIWTERPEAPKSALARAARIAACPATALYSHGGQCVVINGIWKTSHYGETNPRPRVRPSYPRFRRSDHGADQALVRSLQGRRM